MEASQIFLMIGETLGMTIIGTLLAYILGIPIGVLLYSTSKRGIMPNRWLNLLIGGLVNILRSIPCLILVVICLPFTRAILGRGTGAWYAILPPLVVCSFGFVARMVEQSLQEVDIGKIEAVKSLGASNFQLITKVLLPESRSSLISGVAVASVSILGYTSFAYNIGAGGLISNIWSFYSKNTATYLSQWIFWVMVIAVVIIVILLQELGLLISKKIDKRRFAR